MKIGLVISSLASGGAERVLSNMACYWAERGHEIYLITFSSSDIPDFYELDERIHRVRLGRKKKTSGLIEKFFFNLSRYAKLRKSLLSIKPDVLLSFMDSTNVLTIMTTYGSDRRAVVSVRNNPASRYMPLTWRVARKLTYRYAQCVVAQTDGAGSWIRRHCRANVSVIPNPLRSISAADVNRENLIVSAGRMIPEKAHDILLTAFERIARDFPNWRLVILGDGPLRSALAAQVKMLNMESRILLPGTVKDIEEWLFRASLYVQASRSEGFPNALLEAMAAGLPVISTDCEFGPADIVTNGRNGFLVSVDDPGALASAMAHLMGNESLRHQLGREAILVRNRFAQEKIMAQWEAVLKL